MFDKLLKQARHEYTPGQRSFMLGCLAPVFLLLIPYLFLSLGSVLNRWMGLPPIPGGPLAIVIGIFLILVGWLLGLWSVYSQFTIGRGTPLPLMPTRQLIIRPPFSYCRNPMALGAILAYLGVGIAFRSIGAVGLVTVFAVMLIAYIKLVEEKELELRFGRDYLVYKKRTPCMIPRRPGG